MINAYVFAQVRVGRSAEVASEIARIERVISSEVVTGPYDVIACAEAVDMDDLGKLVLARIQAVDGRDTHTDLSRHEALRTSRHPRRNTPAPIPTGRRPTGSWARRQVRGSEGDPGGAAVDVVRSHAGEDSSSTRDGRSRTTSAPFCCATLGGGAGHGDGARVRSHRRLERGGHMNLWFLTACLPRLSLDDIAVWASKQGFEALEVAAWPELGDRPFTATISTRRR
jgi:hypothetical protein